MAPELHVGEEQRFDLDWSLYLNPGATIVSSTWSVVPSTGLTLSVPSFVTPNTQILAKAVSVGAYRLINETVTNETPPSKGYQDLLISVRLSTLFISGSDLINLLPQNTAVTTSEANRYIDAAIARIAESHAPDAAPINSVTGELVEELAYAKALKRHYVKGEAEIDTEPLDKDIERVEKRLDAYDARHVSVAEQSIESPSVAAYIETAPF